MNIYQPGLDQAKRAFPIQQSLPIVEVGYTSICRCAHIVHPSWGSYGDLSYLVPSGPHTMYAV